MKTASDKLVRHSLT